MYTIQKNKKNTHFPRYCWIKFIEEKILLTLCLNVTVCKHKLLQFRACLNTHKDLKNILQNVIEKSAIAMIAIQRVS
jgi:hypothetical protein